MQIVTFGRRNFDFRLLPYTWNSIILNGIETTSKNICRPLENDQGMETNYNLDLSTKMLLKFRSSQSYITHPEESAIPTGKYNSW